MARQRRLWISDVVARQRAGRPERVPVVAVANERAAEAGYPTFPAIWIAPNVAGPQLFIGLAGLSPEEASRITTLAGNNGFGFLSMALPDADLDSGFGPQARTAIDGLIVPEGLAAVHPSESKRNVVLRIIRAMDAVADAQALIARLRAHPDVDATDPGTD